MAAAPLPAASPSPAPCVRGHGRTTALSPAPISLHPGARGRLPGPGPRASPDARTQTHAAYGRSAGGLCRCYHFIRLALNSSLSSISLRAAAAVFSLPNRGGWGGSEGERLSFFSFPLGRVGRTEPGTRMLQMVRTLAQFTIALEDMRDIGDGIDAAFTASSGLGGAAEELPEKGRGAPEVTRRKGDPLPAVGAGIGGGDTAGGGRGGDGCVTVGHVCRAGSGAPSPWQPSIHLHPVLHLLPWLQPQPLSSSSSAPASSS